jgi:hypothetical protein
MTPDGYFKTGDYGRKVGDEYVIEGRVKTDCKSRLAVYVLWPFVKLTWPSRSLPRLQGFHCGGRNSSSRARIRV